METEKNYESIPPHMAVLLIHTCYMRRFFCYLSFSFLRCHVFVIIAFVEPQSRSAIMYDRMRTVISGTCYLWWRHDNGQADNLMKM